MTSERLGQTAHILGSSGGLVSSRFLVRVSGGDAEHNTAGFAGDDEHPIIWDSTPEKDDIGGFPSDYYTGGSGRFYFVTEGDYRIEAFAELQPDSAMTTGSMLISIETAVSLVNPSQPSTVGSGYNPRAAVSDTFHFPGGLAESFEVHIQTVDCDDSSTVARASVTITKLT